MSARGAPGPPALLIAGMHRSGTSLLALFLEGMGVHIGDRLLPGDAGNPTGYGEDVEILEIQRRLVSDACAPHDEGGWPDWGWTPSERFAPPDGTDRELRNYADRRRRELSTGVAAWGWKEPRTTLLLDHWEEVLPDAARVFVYRHPADVQESMLRLGFPREVAAAAPAIWSFYNEALIASFDRRPERSVLVECSAVASEPGVLANEVDQLLDAGLRGDASAVAHVLVDPARSERLSSARSHGTSGSLPDRAWRVLDALESRAAWRP